MLQVILYSLLVFTLRCEKTENVTYIEVLTDTNIHDFVHKNSRAMIFFYTPGCGPW